MALVPFRLKGDRRFAEPHAEEVRIVGIMEHLIADRRQQPALYGSCAGRQAIEEECIVGDVRILEGLDLAPKMLHYLGD